MPDQSVPDQTSPYLHAARGGTSPPAPRSGSCARRAAPCRSTAPSRAGTTMLESCRRPELVAEITLQPVRRYDVDAAVFYSDIVVPLEAAGVGVEIVPGTGPVIAEPVRTRADLDRIPELTLDALQHITDAVRLTTEQLGDVPSSGSPAPPSPSPATSSRAGPRGTCCTPRR